MQVSCWMAGTRRWVVLRFAWRVRDWMEERRMAFLVEGDL